MLTVKLECSKDFIPEAKYVFDFVFCALGISHFKYAERIDHSPGVLIYYGSQQLHPSPGTSLIQIAACPYRQSLKQPFLAKAKGSRAIAKDPILPSELPYLFANEIPSLPEVWYEDGQKSQPMISVNNGVIHCSIDIVASSFYLLNQENERQTAQRDGLNRFRAGFSSVGEHLYECPLVDFYILLFQSFIERAMKNGIRIDFKNRWPNDHPFALVLSHDVDRLRTWTFSKAKRILKEDWRKRRVGEILRKPYELLHSISLKENWSGNFAYITDLEKKYGGNSTFFMVAKKRVQMDPNYSLNWSRVKDGISHIKKSGCNIGLHGSVPSSEDGRFLVEEKLLLEENTGIEIKGNRQHYLRFDINKTFEAIEKGSFKYDSTLGFDSELGFRCGTSLPFYPYNPLTKKPYPFIEIPLILMDTVLMLESKLHLATDEAWHIIEWYLENARRTGFCLSINWHNNNINIADVFGYGKLYGRILAWAQERNAWICSLDDLYDWWVERDMDLKS